MEVPRDHHFIPVFYLKQWVGADGRLEEYKIVRGQLINRRVGPKRTGFVRDLYSFEGLPPDRVHFLEAAFLKRTDDLAARALQNLLAGKNGLPWTDELRSAWSRFVYQLLIRHPDPFAEIREAAEGGYWLQASQDSQREYEALRDESMPEQVEDFLLQQREVRDDILMHLLQVAFDNDRVGVRINNMEWNVLDVSASPYRLLTSDWPLENALGADSPFVAMPVGPHRLFFGSRDKGVVRKLQRRKPHELVRMANLLTVGRARRYVWAYDTSQTRFIRKHMSKAMVQPPFFPTIRQAL